MPACAQAFPSLKSDAVGLMEAVLQKQVGGGQAGGQAGRHAGRQAGGREYVASLCGNVAEVLSAVVAG